MLKLSKFFLYLALFAPVIVARNLFFPFITGKAIFFRTAIELALFCWLVFLINADKENKKTQILHLRKISRHPIFITVTLFTFFYLIAGLFGVNLHNSFWSNFERGEGIFQLIHYWLFFVLIIILIKTKKDWMSFLKTSLTASILISLYALGQLIGAYNPEGVIAKSVIAASARVSGTLGNPSYLSVYLLFHFLFALIIIFSEKQTWKKFAWFGVLLFQIFIFFNTQTRGAILGLAVGIFIALCFLALSRQKQSIAASKVKYPKNRGAQVIEKKSHLQAIARIILGLSLVLLVIFIFTLNSQIWKKIPGLNRFSSFSFSELESRFLTWGSALAGIIERPIFGWGPENFPFAFDKYYDARHFGGESWFDRAHNFFLDYTVSGGFILFLGYLSIFVIFYYIFRRLPNIVKPTQGNMIIKAAFLAVPIAYLVQNIVLFDVLPIYLALFTFLALFTNLTISPTEEIKNERQPEKDNKRQATKFILSFLLVIIVIGSLYNTSWRPLQKNKILIESLRASRRDPALANETFTKAIDFASPVGQGDTVEQLGIFMVDLLQTINQGNIEVSPEFVNKAINYANETFDKTKERKLLIGVKSWYIFGLVNLFASRTLNNPLYFVRAKTIFQEGLKIAPTRFEFIYGLLDISLMENDLETARSLLNLAEKLRPDLEQNKIYEAKFKELSALKEIKTSQ